MLAGCVKRPLLKLFALVSVYRLQLVLLPSHGQKCGKCSFKYSIATCKHKALNVCKLSLAIFEVIMENLSHLPVCHKSEVSTCVLCELILFLILFLCSQPTAPVLYCLFPSQQESLCQKYFVSVITRLKSTECPTLLRMRLKRAEWRK